MARLTVTTRAGETIAVSGRDGISVMELLRAAGIEEVAAVCGGCCSCATCHIYVDAAPDGVLAGPDEGEEDLLESSAHRDTRSRLSCQIIFAPELDGLAITIAPED